MQESSYGKRYLWAFIIATALFIIIFSVAYSVSYFNYQDIAGQNNIIDEYISEIDSMSNVSVCSSNLLFDASERLDVVGNRLSVLERRFGKTDYRVLEQKRLYTDLELRHFDLVKRLDNLCNYSFITALFFYSNSGPYADESDSVGYMVSTFKAEDKERIMVYSLDVGLGYEVIGNLTEKYSIDKIPVVLIDERDKVYANNIRDFEVYLD